MTNYFSNFELCCPCGCDRNNFSPELLAILNSIRTELNRPIYLTSACRCEKHDLDVYLKILSDRFKGKQYTDEYKRLIVAEKHRERTSSHIKGLAVDIKIHNSMVDYYEVLREIFQFVKPTITRIGLAQTFIHIDLDTEKPQNVVWRY
jgi:hypothetical protein